MLGKIYTTRERPGRMGMKNTVLIVGEKFRYSNDFLEYLKRKIYAKLTKVDDFLFIKENDPNILGELENHIAKSSNIIIAASKTNFALIGKMLSTHLSDTLVARGDMLIPSRCIEYQNGSYLVAVQNKLINVLRVDTATDIPPIILSEKIKLQKAFILGEDEESARVLITPIATASDITVTIYKNPSGYIEVIAEEKKYGKLENFLARLRKLFGPKIVIADSLEEFLIEQLKIKNEKVAVVESCTGGMLSYRFVRISGASDVFIGALTTYANEAKVSWLGVNESDIKTHGAVSEFTVSQMLDGALKISGADYVAAISGIAGPNGGSEEKPVGLVYIGVQHIDGAKYIERKVFFGDRELIQSSAANYALKMLCEILQGI